MFKKCVVADGDCDINIIDNSSFLIRETIVSGRGNKKIIFNSLAGKSSNDKVLDFSSRQVTFFANSIVINKGTSDTQKIFNPLTRTCGYSEEN
ncbi:MAG: hypothetical protein LBI80_01860 [Endomicrobium sp.]|nr:hypothetical protein [Endomicrobium sp.]